MLRVRTHRMIQ